MTRTVISSSGGGGSTGYPTSNNPFTGVFGSGLSMVFGNSTTWTVPAGITSVRVRLWGGGGGGTSQASSAYKSGGGGGFALKVITGLTPGSSISITVGAGGATQTTGGTSSFGSYVSATGGEGAATSAYHAGGTGIGGDINNVGGGSGYTNYAGGGGAASLFGNGNDGNGTTLALPPTGGAGGGFGTSAAAMSYLNMVMPSLFTVQRLAGGAGYSTTVADSFGMMSGVLSPLTSMDMIGTGVGGVYGGAGINGGGGGGGGNNGGGPGGFPGGGGGSSTTANTVFGANGLVIVEY